jgi:flagellar hook-associated protein 3 FlgL
MRVTNGMLINNFMRNLNQNLKMMSRTQEKLSSGKKIARPSHDPSAASLGMRIRSDLFEFGQYKKNVQDGISWLDTTDTALGNAGEVLAKIRDLVVYGSNGTQPFSARKSIYDEISQLEQQLMHIANTTYNGRYIFSGTATKSHTVIEESLDPQDVVEVTGENGEVFTFDKRFTFQDNNKTINLEIGVGNVIFINSNGSKAFEKIFDTIHNIKVGLLEGDLEKVSKGISDVDKDMDKVLQFRSQVGAKINRMELTLNRIMDDTISFTHLLSKTEDEDLAEVIMNLTTQESVYRAALATGARIIQPSLMDFLR